MLSEAELESQFRRALDDVLPPVPWLETVVVEGLRSRRPGRAKPAAPRRRFVAAGMAMALLAIAAGTALLLVESHLPAPAPAGPSTLTPAERGQLAALESRPIVIPAMAAGGQCPTTPTSVVAPWSSSSDWTRLAGTGPVYAPMGGTPFEDGRYYDVTYYTDPTVKGVVLIRARFVADGSPVHYIGPWTAGSSDGRDTVGGTDVSRYTEVAFPADRPPSNPLAGHGWGLWKVRQQVVGGACVGFQVDTAAGSQIIVFVT